MNEIRTDKRTLKMSLREIYGLRNTNQMESILKEQLTKCNHKL